MNIFKKVFGDWEKRLDEMLRPRLINGWYAVTSEYQEVFEGCYGLTPEAAKHEAELHFELPWNVLEKRGCCVAKISMEFVEGFRAKRK